LSPQSQRLKAVPRHRFALDAEHGAGDFSRLSDFLEGARASEQALGAQDINRLGERGELLARGVSGPDLYELVWVIYGQWPEEESIHPGECRQVCADCESQHQDGDEREQGTLSQRPRRMCQVPSQRRDGSPGAHVSAFFFGQFDSSEFGQRPSPRLFGSHTLGHVVRRLPVDMVVHLGIELGLVFAFPEH
jgi:hypothetical protein